MNKKNKKICVSRPSLPNLKEYLPYLKKIWQNKILTNSGPFYKEFEREVAKYLGVKYISLFSNGTSALIAALRVLDIKGEVITTPYTFVATANSILWNNNKPVFVDVDPINLNLDPNKIEQAITSKTTAILPVHVYGNPCSFKEIEAIAKKHKLKVIYDACHAFGVKVNNQSIFNLGDLSVASFHATKVFSTFEGGAVISKNKKIKEKLDRFKNFGFISKGKKLDIESIGFNSKLDEVQSAFGLLQLKHVDKNIEKIKNIAFKYRELLGKIPGVSFLSDVEGVRHNYSYFPIFIDQKKYGKSGDSLYNEFKKNNIFPRKYFHPLITNFSIYKDKKHNFKFPVAEKASRSVICLPIYPNLDINDMKKVVKIIRSFCKR